MRKVFVLLVLAAIAFQAHAVERLSCVDLHLAVSKDGQQEQAPRVLVELGQTAAVRQSHALSFSVTPTESGSRADLQFTLSQANAGPNTVFATPRIVVEFGAASAFQVTAPAGEVYRIEVSARRAACAGGSAA